MKSYGYHRTSTREQHLDTGINWFKYVYFYDNRNYRNNRNYVRKNVCNERKNYKCFCKEKINLMNRNERMHLPMGNIDTSVAGVEKCSAVDEALSLFYLYIQVAYSSKEVELICNELKAIARREDFMCNKFDSTKCTYTQVQDALSKINEKQSIRKSKGVYYTPNDVVRFILTNSIKASFGKFTVSNISDMSQNNISYCSFCCNKTVFEIKTRYLIQFNVA